MKWKFLFSSIIPIPFLLLQREVFKILQLFIYFFFLFPSVKNRFSVLKFLDPISYRFWRRYCSTQPPSEWKSALRFFFLFLFLTRLFEKSKNTQVFFKKFWFYYYALFSFRFLTWIQENPILKLWRSILNAIVGWHQSGHHSGNGVSPDLSTQHA